ncbi:MAG: hypothetical protein LBC37_03990, partial [Zoogloeaceae bacterium]|nr:hypothetical protein [Zoogloeaceae bacterium]
SPALSGTLSPKGLGERGRQAAALRWFPPLLHTPQEEEASKRNPCFLRDSPNQPSAGSRYKKGRRMRRPYNRADRLCFSAFIPKKGRLCLPFFAD